MNINWMIAPTLFIALLLFIVGQKSIGRCRSRNSRTALSILWFLIGIPGFLISLYYLHWFDDAKWFYIFRSLPWTELSAAGSGLFAGALSELIKDSPLFSKPSLVVLLCLGITAPFLKPILAPLSEDQFIDRWNDDVCLQSTPSSCGAASAATIFRSQGVNLTEFEIAQKCFSYAGGTENWYLARLFRKHGFNVHYRITNKFPADLRTPAIAGVLVGQAGHFIAIQDQTDHTFLTGDPLSGYREIQKDKITDAFRFTGFFMEIH